MAGTAAGTDGAGRTVLVCSWRDRWHPEAGGAELYLHRVVQWLTQHGWRVTVATAAYAGAPSDEVRDGVRYVRRGGVFSVYPLVALAYLRGMLGRADVIVDVQNGVPFFASLWSRRPVVVLHHHAHREQWRILFGDLVGRVGWWIESQVAPRAQRRADYLTVSDTSRDDLVQLGVGPGRITVVHNGTDRLEPPPGPRSPTPRVAVLGRLVPHKRVELALETVASLAERFPELGLDVVGGGEWRPPLERHAAELGVADRVAFHGHVDEETKARLLHEAWVLALPSVKEGWGLVVMEAATLGTPTVAFAEAGGVRGSVVDGVTGHLAADAAEFTARIGALLADTATRQAMGTAAQEHASRFGWDATGAGVAAVLDRATDRR